jgi:hypothetical protein
MEETKLVVHHPEFDAVAVVAWRVLDSSVGMA